MSKIRITNLNNVSILSIEALRRFGSNTFLPGEVKDFEGFDFNLMKQQEQEELGALFHAKKISIALLDDPNQPLPLRPATSVIDFQNSVLDKDLTAPPAAPATGARYIIASVATSLWAGHDKQIAEWDGYQWVFTTSQEGEATWVEDEHKAYTYVSGTWTLGGGTVVAHVLNSSAHTASGLSTGNVIRASGAAAFDFAQLQHTDLGGVSATQHHSNGNDPTTDQKAALAGSGGTPSATNPYVTEKGLRWTSAPELDYHDVVGSAAIAAAGGDIKLVGRNLLQSQTFDSLSRTEGSASFQVYALKPGVSGITCQVTVGAGGLVVTFNPGTGALVIELAAAGSSDDAIATAINADISQANGYIRAVSSSGGNFTLAQAQTALSGGAGDYANNEVIVGGLEALPANETGVNAAQKWNDTDIVCTTQAVGAATDVVTVAIKSNGVWTQSLSEALV
jgi:hypothetical protein